MWVTYWISDTICENVGNSNCKKKSILISLYMVMKMKRDLFNVCWKMKTTTWHIWRDRIYSYNKGESYTFRTFIDQLPNMFLLSQQWIHFQTVSNLFLFINLCMNFNNLKNQIVDLYGPFFSFGHHGFTLNHKRQNNFIFG